MVRDNKETGQIQEFIRSQWVGGKKDLRFRTQDRRIQVMKTKK